MTEKKVMGKEFDCINYCWRCRAKRGFLIGKRKDSDELIAVCVECKGVYHITADFRKEEEKK